MARKFLWTVEIEIDAVEVEKHLTFGDDITLNDATAYDMVADGLLKESPSNSFRARTIKVRKPDAGSLAFALQFGEPLRIVK